MSAYPHNAVTSQAKRIATLTLYCGVVLFFSVLGILALDGKQAQAQTEIGEFRKTDDTVTGNDADAKANTGATLYYVAPGGDDGNSCLSEEAACQTIAAAVGKASSGDTVLLSSGTYTENLTLNKDLTVMGTSTASSVIDGSQVGRAINVSDLAHVTLRKLTVTRGRADWGGGISNMGTLQLERVKVTGNEVKNYGAGIYNSSGANLTVRYSSIDNNESGTLGGGLANFGQAELWNTAVISNSAVTHYGGGVHNNAGGRMILTNVTISLNSNAYGNVSNSGVITATNATIAFNHVWSGSSSGGISNYGTLYLKNTLLTDNDDRNCFGSGTFISLGHNLDSGDSCHLGQTGDLINGVAFLPPQPTDNGGPTLTHELRKETYSAAIDAGDNSGCPTVDQRGAPRPVDGDYYPATVNCDIGAFEAGSVVPPPGPNLMVQKFSYLGGLVVTEGDEIGDQLEVQVGNDGEAETASTAVAGLFLSADSNIDTGDIPLTDGAAQIPLLAPSEYVNMSFPLTASIPSGVDPGPLYLGVLLDQGNVISEKSEKDNDGATPILVLPSGPYTWTVTSAADTMELVTLRFALTHARAGDHIRFSDDVFPQDVPQVISLTQPLPKIETNELVIDASKQGVVLDGSNLSGIAYGLEISSDYNRVSGLQIQNMPTVGLMVTGSYNLLGQLNPAVDCDNLKISGPPPQPSLQIQSNNAAGVILEGTDNQLAGNLIKDNGTFGVFVNGYRNLIGGDRPEEGNVIGGNQKAGLQISDETATRNKVFGNYIGTSYNGNSADPNQHGVLINQSGSYNQIGGDAHCQGNFISGNSEWGVKLDQSKYATMMGNIIGSSPNNEPRANGSGGVLVLDSYKIEIGGRDTYSGLCERSCNLISGNGGHGIVLSGNQANYIEISSNFIGLNENGTSALPNQGHGIVIENAGRSNYVGRYEGTGNLIAGNQGAGIVLKTGSLDNDIMYNMIGLESDLLTPAPNQLGIWLQNGAADTIIKENVIAGNSSYGIHLQGNGTTATIVKANFIGTNWNGDAGLGNGDIGVYLSEGTSNNQIGQQTIASSRNTVTNNQVAGVWVADSPQNEFGYNLVSDNRGNGYIFSGSKSNGNVISRNDIVRNGGTGVEMIEGAHHNEIKFTDVISNQNPGITLFNDSHHHYIHNNTISDNFASGITIQNQGYSNQIVENIIRHNGHDGIQVVGADSTGNLLSQNRIYGNARMQISNVSGGNEELPAPKLQSLTQASPTTWDIVGQSCQGCTVELFSRLVFSDTTYRRTTTAGEEFGLFRFSGVILHTGNYFDFTATDAFSNTSEYTSEARGIVDLEITNVEVTQATQTLYNHIPLIAGKGTFVRVHVRSDLQAMESNALLEVRRNGVLLGMLDPGPAPSCPQRIDVQINPDRGELGDAFCFQMPSSWTKAGQYQITAYINTDQRVPETDYANNGLTVDVTYEPAKPLTMKLYMVRYPESLVDFTKLEQAYSAYDALAVGDVDGDGLDEILVGEDSSHDVTVYGQTASTDREIERESSLTAGATTGYTRNDALAAGDLDGDGRAELVIGRNDNGTLQVWRYIQQGAAVTWTLAVQDLPAGHTAGDRLAIGDIDGDGSNELVQSADGSGDINVYELSGYGSLPPFTVIRIPDADLDHARAEGLAVADMDGDGRDEILVGDDSDGHVYVYRYNNGHLGSPGNGLPDSFWAEFTADDALAAADIDLNPVNSLLFGEVMVAGDRCKCIDVFAWDGSEWALKTRYDGWHDKDHGVYTADGGLATGFIYDNASQPEIISAASHSKFVEVAEKKVSGPWRTVISTAEMAQGVVSYLERTYPIPYLDLLTPLQAMDFEALDGTPTNHKIYDRLTLARQAEGDSFSPYLALLDGAATRSGGQARPASRVGVFSIEPVGNGDPYPNTYGLNTFIHETGHTLQQQHTYNPRCSPAGTNFPYPEGRTALPGTDRSFRVLDISNATLAPAYLGGHDAFGFARDAAVYGDYAFVATYGYDTYYKGGLQVYDISIGDAPVIVSQLPLEGGGRRIALSADGHYAYVADVFGGLIAVDISDPVNPKKTGFAYIPPDKPEDEPKHDGVPYSYDVAVDGETLYFLDYPYTLWGGKRLGGKLRIFSLSNPASPARLTEVAPENWPNSVTVVNDRAYIGENGGMSIYDIIDPANPQLLGSISLTYIDWQGETRNEVIYDVDVAENVAYLAGHRGLIVVDVADPANLSELARLGALDQGVKIQVEGTRLFLASRLMGLQVVDVTSPANPSIALPYVPSGSPPHNPLWVDGFAIVGDRLYLAGWSASTYGFDMGDPNITGHDIQIRDGYGYRDFMSYCGPQWVSAFTYARLRDQINLFPDSAPISQASGGSGQEMLLVTASANARQMSGQLRVVSRSSEWMATTLPAESPLQLQLLDAGQQLLASYPLSGEPPSEPSGIEEESELTISAAVPYHASTALVQLVISDTVVATRTVSANAPLITVTAPNGGESLGAEATITWTASDADGDKLTYMVLYSPDNGLTWQTLAANWQFTSLTVDTGALPGSTEGRIRVLANDGVNSASDISDGQFTVPEKAPVVQITSPANDSSYESGQTIVLMAKARDDDGYPIAETAYAWFSDRDGSLGTGQSLVVDSLSPGVHKLSVQVTDAGGLVGSATVNITIPGGERTVFLPVVLRN